jgi:hypothetical protein
MTERSLTAAKIAQENRVHVTILKFLADERRILELEIQDWMQKYEEDTGTLLANNRAKGFRARAT